MLLLPLESKLQMGWLTCSGPVSARELDPGSYFPIPSNKNNGYHQWTLLTVHQALGPALCEHYLIYSLQEPYKVSIINPIL